MKLIYQTINNDGSINEPITVELNPDSSPIIINEVDVTRTKKCGIIENYKETYKFSVNSNQFKYTTTDGKSFDNYDKAIDYQRKNDGFRKTCKFCNGRGETFIDRRDSWQYDSPDARIPANLTEWKTCINCNGRGYIDINDL